MKRIAQPCVVAIDGPAGAGKSSVSKLVATKLGYLLIDTGALYRGIAWLAKNTQTPIEPTALCDLIQQHRFSFEADEGGDQAQLRIDQTFPKDELRAPEVTQIASQLSALPQVRQQLLQLQRSYAARGGVVLEGRDIGTVVCPDADFKFFLTAKPEVRAKRRQNDLVKQGFNASFDEVLRDILARDARDENRAIAPLKPAADAVIVDTSEMNLVQVADWVHQQVTG